MLQTSYIIPLSCLVPSGSNPRKTYDPSRFAELADSVRRKGVLQPILVRPIGQRFTVEPDAEDEQLFLLKDNGRTLASYKSHAEACSHVPTHEIVVGERRYRASLAAGLLDIPVVCRVLTDEEVDEFQWIENLQREDLLPTEEADGYKRLLEKHGWTVEELATRIHRSESYVHKRLRLVLLPAAAREALEANRISLVTALMIAGIPDHFREEASKEILEGAIEYKDDKVVARNPLNQYAARDLINRKYTTLLSEACWDLNAPTGELPACATCPKRTGAQGDLFAGLREDLCLDAKCFAQKNQVVWDLACFAAEKKGYRILTEEQHKKVFPQHHYYGNDLQYGCGFVKSDDRPYQDDKKRPWRKLVGKEVAHYVGRTSNGRVVELFKEAEAKEVLRQQGVEWVLKEDKREQDSKGIQQKSKEDQAVNEMVRKAVREKVVAAVLELPAEKRTGLLVAWVVLAAEYTVNLKEIAARFGIKLDRHAERQAGEYGEQDLLKRQMVEQLPDLDEESRWKIALLILASEHVDSYHVYRRTVTANLLGIDEAAVRERAKSEVKEYMAEQKRQKHEEAKAKKAAAKEKEQKRLEREKKKAEKEAAKAKKEAAAAPEPEEKGQEQPEAKKSRRGKGKEKAPAISPEAAALIHKLHSGEPDTQPAGDPEVQSGDDPEGRTANTPDTRVPATSAEGYKVGDRAALLLEDEARAIDATGGALATTGHQVKPPDPWTWDESKATLGVCDLCATRTSVVLKGDAYLCNLCFPKVTVPGQPERKRRGRRLKTVQKEVANG